MSPFFHLCCLHVKRHAWDKEDSQQIWVEQMNSRLLHLCLRLVLLRAVPETMKTSKHVISGNAGRAIKGLIHMHELLLPPPPHLLSSLPSPVLTDSAWELWWRHFRSRSFRREETATIWNDLRGFSHRGTLNQAQSVSGYPFDKRCVAQLACRFYHHL